MRVLAVTNMYPPHHYGGYELLNADVLRRWRDRGHDVAVLVSDWRVPGVDPAAPEDSGIAVERTLRMFWDDHEIVEPGPLGRLAIERHNRRVVLDAIDRHRPDVVSVWAMGCLSLGMLATVAERGIPMVSVVCDDWLVYGPRVDAWHRVVAHRPVLDRLTSTVLGVPSGRVDIGRVATHCFISEATERTALEQSPFDLTGSPIVYAGIDTADFPTVDPAPAADDEPFGWRLLHVGRIDPRKGIDVAIRALTHLPAQATLDVLGWGEDAHLAELHALVAELGLGDRVRFATAPRAELAEHYRRADVFVFAPRWEEPLGLVPIEAMACDTPVVGTGTGGSGEYLADEVTCLRFPVDDDVALAAAVERLAADATLRQQLVRNGRRLAATLTMDRWAEVLEDWHHHAADPAGTPRPDDRRGIVARLLAESR